MISHNPVHKMKLDEIRNELRSCENSIIFAILERNRWKHNEKAYRWIGGTTPLFESLLLSVEGSHAKAGRYSCPEEHPFTIVSSPPVPHPPYQLEFFLEENHTTINHNTRIRELYFRDILPHITEEGHCENQGSAVTADIHLLQAISRRIHLGKVVAESKYRDHPDVYNKLDTDENIMHHITNNVVETSILDRIRDKTARFDETKALVEAIVAVFRDIIIPETKQVQIQYIRLKQEASRDIIMAM